MNIKSKAGEDWKKFYLGSTTSWCNPAEIDVRRFQRFINSPWIRKILTYSNLDLSEQPIVLDAGCGTAQYSLALSVLGFNVHAFDYNPEALKFAFKLLPIARELNPDLLIHFHVGNLLAIPCKAGTFDLVFNQGVLEYFLESKERVCALKEMKRVTRTGGAIIVISQHTGHPWKRFWERLGWEGYTNQPSVARITASTLRAEFEQAGLDEIKTDGIEPWKSFFFYPHWYQRFRLTKELTYLLWRGLERYFPLPPSKAQHIAIQIIAAGRKSAG